MNRLRKSKIKNLTYKLMEESKQKNRQTVLTEHGFACFQWILLHIISLLYMLETNLIRCFPHKGQGPSVISRHLRRSNSRPRRQVALPQTVRFHIMTSTGLPFEGQTQAGRAYSDPWCTFLFLLRDRSKCGVPTLPAPIRALSQVPLAVGAAF